MIDLADFTGKYEHAHYTFFFVRSNETNYGLNVTGYSGTAGDSLEYHNGMQFSTKDRDNDQAAWDCAKSSQGGWWYKACQFSNLNGLYLNGQSNPQGVRWIFLSSNISLKFSQMKLRFCD